MQELKKRKKRDEVLLLMDYECLDREQIIKTLYEIRMKLLEIFKYHIGNENSITPYDLFQEIFNINPNELNIYIKTFWWDVVKRVMRELRSKEVLFIINRRQNLFVLQNEEELKSYINIVDNDIKSLNNMKDKAKRWVKEEKWRKI